jgi:hypothetical protein
MVMSAGDLFLTVLSIWTGLFGGGRDVHRGMLLWRQHGGSMLAWRKRGGGVI